MQTQAYGPAGLVLDEEQLRELIDALDPQFHTVDDPKWQRMRPVLYMMAYNELVARQQHCYSRLSPTPSLPEIPTGSLSDNILGTVNSQIEVSFSRFSY